MKRKHVKKLILISLLIFLAVTFLIIFPVVTGIIYHDNFGIRFKTPEWQRLYPEDFPGLVMENCYFQSEKGQKLAGYKFSKKNNKEPKALVVISHGYGGGGFNTYMDLADYFTTKNCLVFGYDITGNDNSEGDGINGLPQGVIDLDYALRYIKKCPEYKDIPVVLFGHSWGGYSVTNVLALHPEIKAAVSVAGFNSSKDVIKSWGRDIAGPFVAIAMPYVTMYEKMKFNDYGSTTAENSFNNSKTPVMIIHSRNDSTVPPEFGYDMWYKKFGNNPRFKFVEFSDRGHNHIYYTKDVYPYKKEFSKGYTEYVEKNNLEASVELFKEFSKKHLDKKRFYDIDEQVMDQIMEFYNAHI